MTAGVLACLWLLLANIAGMLPTRTGHRRRAAVLCLSAPALAFVLWRDAGAGWALLFLLGAGLLLRHPVKWAAAWLLRVARRGA